MKKQLKTFRTRWAPSACTRAPCAETCTIRSVSISIRSTLLLAALLLVGCQNTPDPTPPNQEVKAAHDALSETQRLILQTIISGRPIPSAPLGMYVTSYLIDATGIHLFSAKNGVKAGIDLLLSNQEKPEESFALLQELGINLQIDVPDMLNRSGDRQKTLDLYIETLSDVYTRCKIQLIALKQQQKNLLSDQHDKRGVVTSIQHDLNLALQKQDYVTASNKQSSIIEAKAA